MVELSRGANLNLSGTDLQVTVAGAAQGTVDLMVFQLLADGTVRNDADFVFFNQPQSPEGAVELVAADRLTARLSRLPAEIDSLAVTVAMSEEVPGTLAEIAGLAVSVTAPGEEHSAPALGLTTERAAVLVEIYRRGDGWKLRNRSAGWTGGLADLVREHGVSVAEEPSPTVDDRTAPPAAPTPAVVTPTAPAGSVAGADDGWPAAPAPGAGPGSAGNDDGWPASSSSSSSGSGGKIDLGKRSGQVSLAKGQKVSIEKTAVIVASISWPPKTDYDVFALIRYRDGRTESVAQFGTSAEAGYQTRTADGAVVHTGDVQRGTGPKAEETIEIRLHPDILAVVPVVYSAQSNGLGSFHKYKVSMAIDNGQGTRIQVDAANGNKSRFVFSCVPGIILNTGTGVQVESLELYSKRMSERRPIITDTLTVQMDAGPVNVFKR